MVTHLGLGWLICVDSATSTLPSLAIWGICRVFHTPRRLRLPYLLMYCATWSLVTILWDLNLIPRLLAWTGYAGLIAAIIASPPDDDDPRPPRRRRGSSLRRRLGISAAPPLWQPAPQ